LNLLMSFRKALLLLAVWGTPRIADSATVLTPSRRGDPPEFVEKVEDEGDLVDSMKGMLLPLQ